MQKHIENKFRNALNIGIIALLVVSFALISGNGINTMAFYEGNAESLAPRSGTGFGFIIAVTIASILFVMYAFDFIVSRKNFNEEEEKKLRLFAARCRGRGYSREEVINLLARHGWKENIIKRYLN